MRPGRSVALAVSSAALAAAGLIAAAAPLTPPPAPPDNPSSEAKRVLGKILFWDEQLSSDDTVACGTCHLPGFGGADPRRVRTPGADGVPNTPDDVFGSPGVVRRDAAGDFLPHAVHGLNRQVTGRNSPSALTGSLADALFWDGRASGRFTDPETSEVAINAGGALESQSVGPPLSSTEMAAEGRTWAHITAKLAGAAPLRLASSLPADMSNAITARPTYPQLFAAAFGDSAISARRIAFALATYERTLVPDQTPWDRFDAGDPTALNPAQTRGWGAFQASHCNDCHTAPEFTDRSFRNIGLRPIAEDSGRQAITGDFADRGEFKVPSLRNVGLRTSFMHNGQFTTLTDVIRFYARAPGAPGQFPENRDALLPQINVPPPAAADIQALLATGLTDPRVAAQTFPFDRPTLYSERIDRGPAVTGVGRAGAGGIVPRMAAPMPPFLGNALFRLGIDGALGGATATLAVSNSAPVAGEVSTATLLGPVTLAGAGNGAGFGTIAWPIPQVPARAGERVWFQWRVTDPSAAGGVALSPVADATLFLVRSLSPDDPVIEPPPPPATHVAGDAALFAESADLSLDWREHDAGRDADLFALQGRLNPRGAGELAGAVLSVAVGDEEIVRATLDADGRARSAGVSAQFDAVTGRFRVSASGLDLRAATGISASSAAETADVVVKVQIEDAGLAADTAEGTLSFALRSQGDRRTRGSYRYARDGLADGAFFARTAALRVHGDGTRELRITGVIDPTGESLLVPDDTITLELGDAAAIELPGSRIRVRGYRQGTTVTATTDVTAPDAPTVRFAYSARTRTFSLVCDRLPEDVLPQDASTEALLDVSLSVPTATGTTEFAMSIGLRRASATSRVWSR